jgi:seryl-tRNA synthetase
MKASALKRKDAPASPSLAEALFRPMGADGLYARTGLFEGVVEALAAMITRQRDPKAEVFRFPPVMSRSMIERSGYLKSFPNLLGCVSCLGGGETEIRKTVDRFVEGGRWTEGLETADLVLTPASCYPVYPIAAARGSVPAEGLVFDVACDCFRREPSKELDRLQSFRMREFVAVGAPQDIMRFRDDWIEKARALVEGLALPYEVEVASDPFFGRGAAFLAASQKEQSLKFELLVPVLSESKPTACISFNYHQDHFGRTWGLVGQDGSTSHTGCVAFGMDRLAVALFAAHGTDLSAWPAGVRGMLGL